MKIFLILLFINISLLPCYAQDDEPALFEGCNDPLISAAQKEDCSRQKIAEFISKKMNYPDSAAANKIEGLVLLRFTIDSSGAVTMVELLKGIDKACNEEALRLLRSMPRFSPARKAAQAVESKMTIPIRFRLNDMLHHPNEDLYQLHWAKMVQDSISRKELQAMLAAEMPFVRDAKGWNYRIENLELTYLKGQKISSAAMLAPDNWSEEMLEIFSNARRGGILVFTARITDKFKTVEVVREFYVR